VKRWPLIPIAAPAAVAIWSGWVGLGQLCGFGLVEPFPGIVPWHLDTAITLPVGVEAYGAYALGAWLTPETPERARAFARRSAVGALALGMTGQIVYHLLAAAHAPRAPWPVVVIVSCMPVVTLGFGAALTHLLRVPVAAPEAAETMPAASAPEEAPEPPANTLSSAPPGDAESVAEASTTTAITSLGTSGGLPARSRPAISGGAGRVVRLRPRAAVPRHRALAPRHRDHAARGSGVLRRVADAGARPQVRPDGTLSSPVPGDAESAAEASLRATLAAGNPWSLNQLQTQFSLTRAQATKVRTRVFAGANGHHPEDVPDGTAP
jgi:hypothetical protein